MTPSKTLAAIEKFSASEGKDEKRKHLGASVVGDNCRRRVQLKFLWAGSEDFSGRMKRLFNRGHREEGKIIAFLRGAGITVYDAGESGELKEQLRIVDCHGHFGGTPDGVAIGVPDLPPDTPCLLEFKTHNDKWFKKLVESGVFNTYLKYYVQMQIYMYKHQLPWALYIGVNKNDDDIYAELVQAKPSIAKSYLAHANEVIFKEEVLPKISESPSWWECKLCTFRHICHNDATPDENCRTCANGRPNKQGGWTCAAKQPYIDTCPQDPKGCQYYTLNTKLFVDGPPF